MQALDCNPKGYNQALAREDFNPKGYNQALAREDFKSIG